MAKNTENDQAQRGDAHNEHEGSSISFYVFIALVLGAITYVEFALVEHQDTWFAGLGTNMTLVLLIGLSVVKFVMVVMFFMHLKQDDRTFTGFFTSGMVIAVGTLLALSALFTVRSVAAAQTPQEELQQQTEADDTGSEPPLAHRSEYPAPKTLDVQVLNLTPYQQIQAGMSVEASGGPAKISAAQTYKAKTTAGGIPLAAPPAAVTLPDPFAQPAAQQPAAQQPAAQQPAAQNPAAPAAAQQPAAQQPAAQNPAAPAAAQPAAQQPATAAANTAGNAGGPLLTDADTSAGEAVFTTNCVSCHQTTGQGIAGAFPPLVGHAPEVANAEGGHEYMEKLLLYGLQGEINVSGQAYNGVMPAWSQLSDDDIANVLNYVLSSWGNADAMPADYPAFTADGVTSQRADNLSSQQVYDLRKTLNLQ